MGLSVLFWSLILGGWSIGEPAASQTGSLPFLEQRLDISYSGESPRQKLDLFRPESKAKLPIVLFVHGGGWFMGDKDFFGVHRNVAKSIARRGYVVVATNYRLSPEVKHPVHVEDVSKALAWIFANPTVHGGDTTRVNLLGHSAGAHLVTLLATDSGLWDKPGGPKPADFSSICGVVGLCGVYQIPAGNQYISLAQQAGLSQQISGITGPDGKAFNPFKIAFGEDEVICRKASPITHVRKGLPPFLLLVAERDLPGLGYMAEKFEGSLIKCGNSCKNLTIPETTHVSLLSELNRPRSATALEVGRFLEEVSQSKSSKP
jgi:acetyl esterase/lipase